MKKPVAKTPVKAKPVPKAKVPAKAPVKPVHHKPVHLTRAQTKARHAAAVKAAKTRAANAKKAKQHPRRQLALGDGVACCSAEAVAASLRLAGVRVSDEDVLGLYWRTAADADEGASILATLEAAAAFGLAGVRPVSFTRRDLSLVGLLTCDDENPLTHYRRSVARPVGLLVGLELPGSHAVLDDGTAWWSWGEPYSAASWPDAVLEEAWEVTWPDIR